MLHRARGEGNHERAETVMNNSFSLLLISGAALTVFFLALKKPILYLFGASDQTFPYADAYLTIYLVGTVFCHDRPRHEQLHQLAGLRPHGNDDGAARRGGQHCPRSGVYLRSEHGVQGAALATVISQFLSAAWVLRFLTGKQAIYRLKPERMRLQKRLVGQISALGLSGFIMAVTNSAVQIVCNATLQQFGGDLYVGIMTVINSIREVLTMPVNGLTNGAQPVMGYNYGAHLYSRVRSGIRFTSIVCILYTTLAWIILMMAPEFFLFTSSTAIRN